MYIMMWVFDCVGLTCHRSWKNPRSKRTDNLSGFFQIIFIVRFQCFLCEGKPEILGVMQSTAADQRPFRLPTQAVENERVSAGQSGF